MKNYDGYTAPRDMDMGQTLGSGIYGFNTKNQKEFAKGFSQGAIVGVLIFVAVVAYFVIRVTLP